MVEPNPGKGPDAKPEKMLLSFLCKFIKPYNGDRETLPAFLTNCDNAISLASIEQKDLLYKFIIAQLEGKAQIACSLKTFKDWAELKSFLKSTFGEKKHSSHLLIELQNCRQSQSETVTQYGLRIESCLTRIQADIHNSCDNKEQLSGRIAAMEDLALNTFLLGLNHSISTTVRCRNPSSLNEAIQQAVEEEKILNLSKVSQKPFKKCSICFKSGHSSSECYKNKTQYSSNSNPSSHKSHKSYHMSQSHNNSNQIKICTYCKNKGHIITECRKREYNNRMRSDRAGMQSNTFTPPRTNNDNSNSANVHFCTDSTNSRDLN